MASRTVVQQIAEIRDNIRDGLEVVWKLATVQYLYEFMLSNPTQLMFLWPFLVPLAFCVASITICITIVIAIFAIIASFWLVVFAIPFSGPITCAVIICYLLYIGYKACVLVINKVRILYANYIRVKEMVKAAPGRMILFVYETISNKVNATYRELIENSVRKKYAEFMDKLEAIMARNLYDADNAVSSHSTMVIHKKSRPSTSRLRNKDLKKREDAPTKPAVRRGLPPTMLTREKVREVLSRKHRRYQRSHSYVHVDTSRFTPRFKEI